MAYAFVRQFAAGLAFFGLLALGGCGGGPGLPDNRVAAITLTYPYGEDTNWLFPNYDRIIADAAGSYVALTVTADSETIAQTGSEVVSAASGTIVHPGGYIVTAAHIAVDPKYRVRATTVDGRVHRGQVLHVDRNRELALIKIPAAPGLQAARFADSDRVGDDDPAAAIGSPRRLTGVVSMGRIKEQRLGYPLRYNGFTLPGAIVLSMLVEPGHSGGPVFNDSGELIGMIASFALGDTRKVPYVAPKIAFAVRANDIAAYLREVAGL